MCRLRVATAHGRGVVVLHDALGMSNDLRSQADRLAGEGYVAAAPDLLHWAGKFACIRQIMRDVAAGRGLYARLTDVEHLMRPGEPYGPLWGRVIFGFQL
jgi:dienelactone hydrolase